MEFREMRRSKQALTAEEINDVLIKQKRGVLAVNGDRGYPFCLPIDFYYEKEDGCLYFHMGLHGQKIDAIHADDKVCFTTFNKGDQRTDWSYYVKSVIAFGRASFLPMETEEEKTFFFSILKKFGCKYYPTAEEVEEEIRKDSARVQIMRLQIEHLTGKLVHEK